MIPFFGIAGLSVVMATIFLVMTGGAGSRAAEMSPAEPIPRAFFGMHFHRADTTTRWPAVPIGSWRLWDANVAWPQLQPGPGKWDFQRLDRYVAMAKLTGASLLLPLGLTPGWASARPTEKSSYSPGNAAEPRDIEDWKRYVRTVAERYKGRIYDYEIWNEVNVPDFYSGSVETMVTLTREAYRILKDVDPKNRLVSPSVVGGGRDPLWLDEFLQKGGGRYIDIVGYHFYVPKGSPESVIPLVKQVQGIMAKHGIGERPLWNTETGWLIQNTEQRIEPGSYDANIWKVLDQNDAAAYLARALIISWAAGVRRYYWYAWDSGNMGLIEPNSKNPKPPARAFGTVVRWLEGGRMGDCGRQGPVWICAITGREGTAAHIVWTEAESPVPFRVPSGWGVAEIEALDGTKRRLEPGRSDTISISPAPMRLTP
jgi:hypothetical protein